MSLKKLLPVFPFFLLLLPLFFVFHGYVENFDLVPAKDALILFILYLAYTTAVFFLFLLLYRKWKKAAIATFLVMFFYFFFGYIYDSIWSLAPHSFFSRYSIILGGMSVLLIALIIWLFITKNNLVKLTMGVNLFFIFLLITEIVLFAIKLSFRKHEDAVAFKKNITVCDSCSKPDIYLILTDGYPGDRELKDLLAFDNSYFKNELKKRGFHCPTTTSNYNYTPFSIASIMNMEYLPGIKGIDTDPGDLSICFGAMKEARFFQVLQSHGYELHNFSLFDIHKQPSPYSESVLPSRTKFITSQTLLNRVERNMLYNNNAVFKSLQRKRTYISYNNIIKAYGSTMQAVNQSSARPRFIYSHLEMPHYPYYFDSRGRPVAEENLREGKERDTAMFKEYLIYTNQKLLNLIDSIQLKNKRPAAILMVSDHGYRELPFRFPIEYEFNNSVAIYLPGKDYSKFYEGISNINICRSFLNVQFNQQLPMVRDSTVKVVIK